MNKHWIFALVSPLLLGACTSGPFKLNQSTHEAPVIDQSGLKPQTSTNFQVLIFPSGAIKSTYTGNSTVDISHQVMDSVSTTYDRLRGTADQKPPLQKLNAAAISSAITPELLSVYFATRLADRLNSCGIQSTVYPNLVNANNPNWTKQKWALPAGFAPDSSQYRFLVEAGVRTIDVQVGLTDKTLQATSYVRVFETNSLKQIGRYAGSTGVTGSVSLQHLNDTADRRNAEIGKASRQATQFMVQSVGADMCSIMTNF